MTKVKVTLSLDEKLYSMFKRYKEANCVSLSQLTDKMIFNTLMGIEKEKELAVKYYVLETENPFIYMDKIFDNENEAIVEAEKSDKYSGVVKGCLVFMK